MESILFPLNNIKNEPNNKYITFIYNKLLYYSSIKFILVFKINETSPSLIMINIIFTKVYANIELGSPK